MKHRTRKGLSIALVLVLLAAFLPGTVASVEPPPATGLTLTADKTTANPGDTVNFTVGFNLLSGAVSGYSATQIAVFLPDGLSYASSVVYVGGSPAVVTTTPAATPAGTSVVVNFDNTTMTAGPAQVRINANVSSTAVRGSALTINAQLYLQPTGAAMPGTPNEQAAFTLQIANVQPPTPPPIPITPQIYNVIFNLNGGVRVGGGALSQAVPTGGAAVEPYVFRQGYIFIGWDVPFNNVQQNITTTARWTSDPGTIPIVPPIANIVEGHFVGDRNTFMQYSHMPLIYYANRHVATFVSVELDGRILATGTHYIATTGKEADTTAIHLKASYLNTLAIGSHTLRVNFRDGIYVEAPFTVTAYVNTFNDVSVGNWFFEGVRAMNASELLRGVSYTQFNPQAYMTRGMVVTLLYRFAGEPSVAGFRNPFPDVAAGQYYTNAVIWAAANGIVTGHDNGLFTPNNMMTREQFAAVLYRYQNALGSVTMDILMDLEYSDFNQISSFARGPVNKLTMQGVFRDWPSDPAGNFRPTDSVSRAEVATVMRFWIESIGW